MCFCNSSVFLNIWNILVFISLVTSCISIWIILSHTSCFPPVVTTIPAFFISSSANKENIIIHVHCVCLPEYYCINGRRFFFLHSLFCDHISNRYTKMYKQSPILSHCRTFRNYIYWKKMFPRACSQSQEMLKHHYYVVAMLKSRQVNWNNFGRGQSKNCFYSNFGFIAMATILYVGLRSSDTMLEDDHSWLVQFVSEVLQK